MNTDQRTVASLSQAEAKTIHLDALDEFKMSTAEYAEAYGKTILSGDDGDTGPEGPGDGSDGV